MLRNMHTMFIYMLSTVLLYLCFDTLFVCACMCACGCEGVYMCVHVGVNGNEGWVICERGVICDCECEFGNVGDM